MRVSTALLQTGCILTEDVMSLSNRPIIPKNTVLNQKHLEVLAAFLIKEVDIEPVLVNGVEFLLSGVKEEAPSGKERKESVPPFMNHYLRVVQDIKKQFISWQSGVSIEIIKVRQVFLPLLEEALEKPDELRRLYHYSTKQDYIYHHSVSVGILAGEIAKKLNFEKGDCLQIAMAGVLSDCGMAKIQSRILTKQSSLTEEEFKEIKEHPLIGYKLIKDNPMLKEGAKLAILQHHERVDGSGYPLGVLGDKLHSFGKVVAVADVYHAMTSERIYRSKKSPFLVLELLQQDSFGKFDYQAVQALIAIIAKLTNGTKIKLSNGLLGEVTHVNTQYPTRPWIKVFSTNEIIQLENNRDLFIDEII